MGIQVQLACVAAPGMQPPGPHRSAHTWLASALLLSKLCCEEDVVALEQTMGAPGGLTKNGGRRTNATHSRTHTHMHVSS